MMTLGLPLSTLYAFLLVLARVSGLIVFLPVPGIREVIAPVRVVLALTITFALFPVWPSLPDELVSMGQLCSWAFMEAGFGLAAGLAVSFLTEAFQLAMQFLGLQVGYGYALTIDPTSQADAGVLQVLTMLIVSLLFFAFGIDRELLRVLAVSFQKFPAGSWAPTAASLEGVIHLGGGMFSMGLRLAMPVVGLLLLIDVALALIGRMQQQLQLLSLAFPIKMLAGLSMLMILAPALARLFQTSSAQTMAALWQTLGR
jgi:flagellar biosynthetic protein FliR